jgi:nucleoside-diphosphate-sugar epimerase
VKLAILGATSQIARDLIIDLASAGHHELYLFARRPQAVNDWLYAQGLAGVAQVGTFGALGGSGPFEAILNFVGVGDPAQASAMGARIFDVTQAHDELALAYLHRHPGTRYLFMSSGAAFGQGFEQPADENTLARFNLNRLQPQDWYGLSKLQAEARHRSMPELPIIDIRIFNYFSPTQDLSARFLVTDILRAIREDSVLITSSDYIVRDYLHPHDFHSLICCLLRASPTNDAVDCFTRAPIDKSTLLACMESRFGLKYEVAGPSAHVNATGLKRNYYSVNRRAGHYGFVPTMTSLDCLVDGFCKVLKASPLKN